MAEASTPGYAYPHLFTPWQLGPVTLSNRLVMGAMHTGLERLDRAEERIGAFYRARAKGGIGMIITGGVSPNPEGRLDAETALVALLLYI